MNDLQTLYIESDSSEKLNTYHASLAVLSTIIGGGIVALPFCAYQLGFMNWALLNAIFAYITYESCSLYILLH